MKHSGKGGQILKDSVAIANVIDFIWSEEEGRVYGQMHNDLSANIALDGDPLRVGDTFDAKLKLYDAATKQAQLSTVMVKSSNIPVKQGELVIQSITATSDTTAVYA